jgi:hypothetical protein
MGLSLQQVFFTVVGATIGAVLGGPLGAIQGASLGYTIGTAFTTVELPPGPKIDNNTFTDSSYGSVIPKLYGTDVVPTNIIWMRENKYQVRKRRVKLAKKQYQDVFDYYATFALALGEGPFKRVVKVYANNILLYNADTGYVSDLLKDTRHFIPLNHLGGVRIKPFHSSSTSVVVLGGNIAYYQNRLTAEIPVGAMRFYPGDFEQLPDPAIITHEGEFAPAFRGTSYLLFENLLITEKFYNTMPTFKVIAERDDFYLDPQAINPITIESSKLSYTTDDGSLTSSSLYFDIQSSLIDKKVDLSANKIGTNPYLNVWSGVFGAYFVNKNIVKTVWGNTRGLGVGASWPGSTGQTRTITIGFANNSVATPISTISRYAFGFVNSEYDINSLVSADNGSGNRPSASHVKSTEAWLYPFDIPVKESYFSSWIYASSGSTAFTLQMVYPVLNTDNLYFIIYSDSSGIMRFALARIRGDRFRVAVIDGFHPQTFNMPTTVSNNWEYALWPTWFLTPENSDQSQNFVPFYFNDKVYIHYQSTNYGIASLSGGGGSTMICTLCVPVRNFNFGPAIPFRRKSAMYEWGTSTSYTDGNFYIVDQEVYMYHGRKKFITEWTASPYYYSRLIPDNENGELFGLVLDGSVDTASAEFLTRFPNQATLTYGHLYKIDTITHAPLVDYGNLVTYLNAATGGGKTYYKGVWAVRTIGDYSYLMNTEGIVRFSADGFLDYSYRSTEKIIEPTTGSISTSSSRKVYNLLPKLLTDDYSEYLVGSYCVSDSGSPPPTNSYQFNFANAEYRVIRFYHSRFTAKLKTNVDLSLADVTEAIVLENSILDSNDIDVSDLDDRDFNGMVVAEISPAINSIQALQKTYLFDIVEEDYKLKFIQRRNASLTRTIAYTDLRATLPGDSSFEIKPTVPANFKAPSIYRANYRSIPLEYERDVKEVEQPFNNNFIVSDIDFPVSLYNNEALELLETVARATEYAQGGLLDVQMTFKHSDLEINQFIKVQTEAGDTFEGRIINLEKGKPGLVKATLINDSLTNYSSASFTDDEGDRNLPIPTLNNIVPVIIDGLPFSSDQDQPGVWVGAYTESDDELLYDLSISYDEGTTFNSVYSDYASLPAAYCLTALATTGSDAVIDYTSVLTIDVLCGTFETVTLAELLADETTNTYFYGSERGWEIIRVLQWVDNGNGTFSSNGVIRGYKGTAHLVSGHEIGDMLYAANENLVRVNLDPDKINSNIMFSISSGNDDDVATSSTIEYYYDAAGRLPLPVINVTGRRLSNNDWYFTWTRQSRIGIELVDYSDVQQDESTEQYNLYIINTASNNVVVRTITVTDTTVATYTSAQQVTDFGSNRTTLSVAIAKVSSVVGIGTPSFNTF